MKTLVSAGACLFFGGCSTVPADPLRTTFERRDVMREVMARNDKVVLLSSEELRRDKPVLLLLHGATDDPTEMMSIAREWMETHNVLLYSYNFHHSIRRIGLRLVREMKSVRAAMDNTNLTVITYSYSAIIFRKTILLPGAADAFAGASLVQLVPTAGGSFLARSLAYRFAISLVSLASKASAAQSPYGSIAKELWDGDGNKNFSEVIRPERVHTLLLENDAHSLANMRSREVKRRYQNGIGPNAVVVPETSGVTHENFPTHPVALAYLRNVMNALTDSEKLTRKGADHDTNAVPARFVGVTNRLQRVQD